MTVLQEIAKPLRVKRSSGDGFSPFLEKRAWRLWLLCVSKTRPPGGISLQLPHVRRILRPPPPNPLHQTRPLLTFEESRVLGCLLEKEATVPDQYPLTFNSLFSACNQSSNREPVTDFGTDTVEEAMEGLRYKKLSILVHQAGARVPKCKHTLEKNSPT